MKEEAPARQPRELSSVVFESSTPSTTEEQGWPRGVSKGYPELVRRDDRGNGEKGGVPDDHSVEGSFGRSVREEIPGHRKRGDLEPLW